MAPNKFLGAQGSKPPPKFLMQKRGGQTRWTPVGVILEANPETPR